VLTANGRAIDENTTRERRKSPPATKLFHRHEYRDSLE